jgi:hypothetical protein
MAAQGTPAPSSATAAAAAASARGALGRAARRGDDPLLPAPLLADASARALRRGADPADGAFGHRRPSHTAIQPAQGLRDRTFDSRRRCRGDHPARRRWLMTASYIVAIVLVTGTPPAGAGDRRPRTGSACSSSCRCPLLATALRVCPRSRISRSWPLGRPGRAGRTHRVPARASALGAAGRACGVTTTPPAAWPPS